MQFYKIISNNYKYYQIVYIWEWSFHDVTIGAWINSTTGQFIRKHLLYSNIANISYTFGASSIPSAQ